jgi:hypothetical protein
MQLFSDEKILKDECFNIMIAGRDTVSINFLFRRALCILADGVAFCRQQQH